MVASFTRAAVAELLTRNLPIEKDHIGTLHSLAYRTLDHPEICETAKHLKEFSQGNPWCALATPSREGIDDGYAGGTGSEGEKLLREYSRLRALMRPRESWPPAVLRFAHAWEGYKSETGTLDFTDLIERAYLDVEHAPGMPEVGFIDEAQDLSILEASLARKWARSMETVVFCFDDDQTIYRFKGSDPASFVQAGLPAENVRILKQSYRVPRAVQRVAEHLISFIPASLRYQKEYLPREEEGAVEYSNLSIRTPEQVIEVALRHVEAYKSVILLTTCGYMLSPFLAALRGSGIPFSNPYRRRRRDWNPLHRVKNQKSAAERVAAFAAGLSREPRAWTLEELELWLPLTKGVARRDWKKRTVEWNREALQPVRCLLEVMEMADIVAAQGRGIPWLEERFGAQWQGSGAYAAAVGKRDTLGLHEEPLFHIGTIHSVKGGEGDVIILAPDLSPQGQMEWLGRPESRHNIIRQMYVGMTRARERLILLSPGGRMYFPWPRGG